MWSESGPEVVSTVNIDNPAQKSWDTLHFCPAMIFLSTFPSPPPTQSWCWFISSKVDPLFQHCFGGARGERPPENWIMASHFKKHCLWRVSQGRLARIASWLLIYYWLFSLIYLWPDDFFLFPITALLQVAK